METLNNLWQIFTIKLLDLVALLITGAYKSIAVAKEIFLKSK
jgi:hypothetical protein